MKKNFRYIQALAKFHAASLVLEYNEPERYAKIRSEVKEVLFPSDTEHKGIKSMVSALPSLTIFYLRAGATPEDDHAKEIEYFANKSDKIYSMIKVSESVALKDFSTTLSQPKLIHEIHEIILFLRMYSRKILKIRVKINET